MLKMKGNPKQKVHQLASPNAMVLNILIKGSMKENKKERKAVRKKGQGRCINMFLERTRQISLDIDIAVFINSRSALGTATG